MALKTWILYNRKLLIDRNDNIWLAGDFKVYLYKDNRWWTFNTQDSELLGGTIEEILEGLNSDIRFVTASGLSYFRSGQWGSIRFPIELDAKVLATFDGEGNLWISGKGHTFRLSASEISRTI